MSSNAQRIGKYEVQATIAKGPRSTVLRGTDGNTGKRVALKVIAKAALNSAMVPAYRKYGQALARLEHPGIAAFLDLVEEGNGVCVVTEFCEGVPLASLLKDGAHPEMKNVWDIARRMLEALGFAHSRGAIHRDLKPSDVILAPDGALKIVDFGVSVLHSGAAAEVHYRAPESFVADGTITARTDIYHAGAIIYQLITGKLPFTGTAVEVEHRVLQERPSDPSSYNNKIAWQLDWVIQKALSKEPAERFNTTTDFAEGLRLGLQDTVGRPLDPITPPPPLPQPGAAPAPAAPPTPAPKPTPVREPTKPPVEAGPARPTAAGAPVETGAQSPSAAGAPVETGAQSPSAAGAPVEMAAQSPSAAGDPVETGAQAPSPPPDAPAQAGAQSPAPAPTPAPPAAKSPASPAASLAQKAQGLAKAAPAVPAPAAKAAASRARVLFVDDDERILNAVRALFRQDYDVVTAVGGEAALAAIKESPFHVIVSDQRMPGITGVELLRQARALAPNAVRLLLTGYTDLAALVGSINQGEIFRFVMKPWDNEELKKAMADATRIALELAATARTPATPATDALAASMDTAAQAPAAAHPRSAGSILVIDPREGLSKGLERLLAGAAEVIQVDSPQEAAKLLHGREIAAIVADLGAGTDGLVALFKQLKEKRPEILSILIAEEPDSELGIELINKAQIYRFLPKPVSAKELRTQVAAALRRYATFKQIPALQRQAGGASPSVAAERARATPDRNPPGSR